MRNFAASILALAIGLWSINASAAISADESNPGGKELTVTSAVYGGGTKVADVPQRITELLRTERDGFAARADWLQVDPRPYKAKALAIIYRYRNAQYLFVAEAGERVSFQVLIENARR